MHAQVCKTDNDIKSAHNKIYGLLCSINWPYFDHSDENDPQLVPSGWNSILHGSDEKPAFYTEGGKRSEGLCPEDL
jgi:hypothetical protein